MVWGTLSGRWGRRPIVFACLATLSLSCVGLALVPTSAYWLLVLLRCVQAAGSASTVAIGTHLVKASPSRADAAMIGTGAGIIADIATPAERGGFFGLFGVGPLVCSCSTCFEWSRIPCVLGRSLSWSCHRRSTGSGSWLEVLLLFTA